MKLNPEVYRLAAELVPFSYAGTWCAVSYGCCVAIMRAAEWHECSREPYYNAFSDLFRPKNPKHSYWMSWGSDGKMLNGNHVRERRILALLLMAEIVADRKRRKRK
jgi:hypothetical protein